MNSSTLAIALAALDWVTAIILVVAARRHASVALRERALGATLLAFAATLVAALRVNSDFGRPLTEDQRIAIVIVAMVLMSIPGVVFLVLFLRNEFGGDE